MNLAYQFIMFKKFFVLLAVLCCSNTSEQHKCTNRIICIYSHQESECKRINTTNIASQLFPLKDRTEENICVYLTSEIHYLDQNFNFSDKAKRIEIHGIDHSYVSCNNQAGLYFYNKKFVFISNIVFQNCSEFRSIELIRGKISIMPVTVYFKSSSYKLENVTISNSGGLGVYALQCYNQVIEKCHFNDTKGHLKIKLSDAHTSKAMIIINETSFHNARSLTYGGGIELNYHYIDTKLVIMNCTFERNQAPIGDHIYIYAFNKSKYHNVFITDCTFSQAMGINEDSYGVFIKSKRVKEYFFNVTIQNSHFTDNGKSALALIQMNIIQIDTCSFRNNTGTAICINKRSVDNSGAKATICKTEFHGNSRALSLYISINEIESTHRTVIKDCDFSGHILPPADSKSHTTSVLSIEGNPYYNKGEAYLEGYANNSIIIENSSFTENRMTYNNDGDCSALYIRNMDNITLDNTNFTNNNCTGIVLQATIVQIRNHILINRNTGLFGGALQLRRSVIPIKDKKIPVFVQKYSKLHFLQMSELQVSNNTAIKYGGGLYIEETCEERNPNGSCFFHLNLIPDKVKMYFVSNNAILGGDAIFGGCLSNCSIFRLNKTNLYKVVNITKKGNIFWKLVQLGGKQSPSRFAEYPQRVVFCTDSANGTEISMSHNVTAYKGLLFNISLMVVDKDNYSSVGFINIEVVPSQNVGDIQFGEGQENQETTKYCRNYSYSVSTSQDSVGLNLLLKRARSRTAGLTWLNVKFEDCPFGFLPDKEKKRCTCPSIVENNGIQCSDDHSLIVSALTWVGKVQGRLAVQHQNCQYCKAEGEQVITEASDEICIQNRAGILCGACAGGYSLKLGGHRCGDCSNSTYKGVLLILLFIFLGLLLVITLLKLNLTVSTGLINAFIFYSNIVYSNHDIFLPINNESNNVYLNNAVSALYTFQAWINLDFGFDVCFFDGLTTYQATWIQFIFPLYIWVLILILILSSHFSIRVSKLIGENAVSVLATLFLLSYTKLLLTIISVFSYITLSLDNGKRSHPLWVPDANIKYLSDKHIPLFIVGVFMTLFYIIPFTLLIAFGPILQAKSEYRIFKWINKIKPFLDTFYGPFTDKYRYWPGLLLITRVTLLNMFAFYSLGDTFYKLASMLVTTSLLFVIWILSGLCLGISSYIYSKKSLNYMEVFFLLNLVTYSVTSLYFKSGNPNNIERQQTLAIITVGSAFVVFCGILVYHVSIIALKFKVTHKIIDLIIPEIVKKYIKSRNTNKETPPIEIDSVGKDTSSTTPTSTSFEFTELREPLLN